MMSFDNMFSQFPKLKRYINILIMGGTTMNTNNNFTNNINSVTGSVNTSNSGSINSINNINMNENNNIEEIKTLLNELKKITNDTTELNSNTKENILDDATLMQEELEKENASSTRLNNAIKRIKNTVQTAGSIAAGSVGLIENIDKITHLLNNLFIH